MESGKGGGNSYWPGFVDALTNVIIAMIFVVVVLAIALSFAAQLMGKRVADKLISEYKAQAAASAASAVATAAAASPDVPPVPESKLQGRTIINVKGNEAASAAKSPQITPARNVLQLKYAAGALTLDDAAMGLLRDAIKAMPESSRDKPVVLVASGPAMVLSDNQRSAFLRLMDVRNALIAQGYPATSISTRIDANSDTAMPMISIAFTEGP